MGIPLPQSTNIPQWKYHFVTLCPNYIHVLATAVTAGGSWTDWYAKTDDAAHFRVAFLKHWEYIPLVGPLIGNMGIPGLLTGLLVESCIVHCAGVFWPCSPEDGYFDAANLLFVGKAIGINGMAMTGGKKF